MVFQGNQVSRFHSITADEQWHFYYGNPFTVYLIDPNTGALEVVNLGPQEGRFNVVIPNGKKLYFFHFFQLLLCLIIKVIAHKTLKTIKKLYISL